MNNDIASRPANFSHQTRRMEQWWREGIPLVAAMGARIEKLDDQELIVCAPLAPNRNHMATAFGGSLLALATLTGWGIAKLMAGETATHVVIQRSQMKFLLPVNGQLRARCRWPDDKKKERFNRSLATRNRARIDLEITLFSDAAVAAEFCGRFAALRDTGYG
ncbi:MAG: YiiD C-terminal domain-containing protein [Proteobacteria bacterium]|nr:YiiD C-terminal domain-containing protein [Pseudomonadota bacterium]